MSFSTGSVDVSRRLIDALRIFKLTVSFGSVNSLCEMPCTGSHASIPPELRQIPDDLVRLSVGIEDIDDLLHDLRQAFELATHPHVSNVRAVRHRDTDENAALLGLHGAASAAAVADKAEITAVRSSVAHLVAALEAKGAAVNAAALASTRAIIAVVAIAAVGCALLVRRRGPA